MFNVNTMQTKHEQCGLKFQKRLVFVTTFPGTGVVDTCIGVGIPKFFWCALSSKLRPLRLFSPTFRAHCQVVSRSCRSASGPSTKNARTYKSHTSQFKN